MTQAYSHNVGESNYSSMAVQPKQITYMVHGTTCFNDVAKYLTRNKQGDNDRLKALKKALHNIEIEEQEAESGLVLGKYYTSVPDTESAIRLIKQFSEQFSDKGLILDVLVYMTQFQYTRARNILTNFINITELSE